MEDLEIVVGIEAIGSYKRLSYTVWYAFAEFVDNSTQAYFNNKKALDSVFAKSGDRLTVEISYDKLNETIRIKDNSIGMSDSELRRALMIGKPPKNNSGRSKYGLGLKTAACWLGDNWTIETKKLGETLGVKTTIDVDVILEENNRVLPTDYFDADPSDHYTEIVITRLNRQYHGNTLNKVEEYLKSMYRLDFSDYGLVLIWQSRQLVWDNFESRFYITQDGKAYKKNFSFDIGTGEYMKNVKGWVGVLAKGSRKDAGFSIIQNRRVIQGWPDAYRPSSLFGSQETGTNDLVNQRLIGELYLDGFAVSHTKDRILWQDDEEREIEEKLVQYCTDARNLAATFRVGKVVSAEEKISKIKVEALVVFESELKSDEFRDKVFLEPIPEEKAISYSNKKLVEAVQRAEEPSINITIGTDNEKLTVLVYLRSTSEYEPYLLLETSTEDYVILVIINVLHPYWQELKNLDGILDFIRQCVYDGVSEWKARRKTGKISPDTIKYFKDALLRLPYEISNNKFDTIGQIDFE